MRSSLLTIAVLAGCFSEAPAISDLSNSTSSSDARAPLEEGRDDATTGDDIDASTGTDATGTDASSGTSDASTGASSDSGTSDDAGASSDSGTSDDAGASSDSGTSDAGTANTCAHDPCDAGPPLVSDCAPCIADVCGSDPYCCSSWWDLGCAAIAADACSEICG